MPKRKLVNRLRAICSAIAVLAILVYLNTSQAENDSEGSLYVVGAMNTSVARVLAERHAAAVTNAWIEYTLLVSAATCAVLVIAAPRLVSSRVRA